MLIEKDRLKCPMNGCKQRKRRDALCCPGHWQMLDRPLRRAICSPAAAIERRVQLREAFRIIARYEELQAAWFVRGLSIQQPWASAYVVGPKDAENRTRRFNVPPGGLWLGIHAGAELDRSGEAFVRALWPELPPVKTLARSAVLGAVRVDRWVPRSEVESDWAVGPYCAVRGARVLLPKPMPCPGALGLFKLPLHILEALHAARAEGSHA